MPFEKPTAPVGRVEAVLVERGVSLKISGYDFLMGKRETACAYCGKIGKEWTDDHVAPSCLWGVLPLPSGTVTVPTCFKCNSYWSNFEGYFRAMAVLLSKRGGHPLPAKMLHVDTDPDKCGTVTRQVLHKDDRLKRQILNSYRKEPHFLPNGLYAGQAAVIDMDWRQWDIVVGKMVRGYWYMQYSKPLPLNYEVFAYRGDGFLNDLDIQATLVQMKDTFDSMGDDVFFGKRAYSLKDPHKMAFYLVFYKALPIYAQTQPVDGGITDPSHPYMVSIDIAERSAAKLRRIANRYKLRRP